MRNTSCKIENVCCGFLKTLTAELPCATLLHTFNVKNPNSGMSRCQLVGKTGEFGTFPLQRKVSRKKTDANCNSHTHTIKQKTSAHPIAHRSQRKNSSIKHIYKENITIYSCFRRGAHHNLDKYAELHRMRSSLETRRNLAALHSTKQIHECFLNIPLQANTNRNKKRRSVYQP